MFPMCFPMGGLLRVVRSSKTSFGFRTLSSALLSSDGAVQAVLFWSVGFIRRFGWFVVFACEYWCVLCVLNVCVCRAVPIEGRETGNSVSASSCCFLNPLPTELPFPRHVSLQSGYPQCPSDCSLTIARYLPFLALRGTRNPHRRFVGRFPFHDAAKLQQFSITLLIIMRGLWFLPDGLSVFIDVRWPHVCDFAMIELPPRMSTTPHD